MTLLAGSYDAKVWQDLAGIWRWRVETPRGNTMTGRAATAATALICAANELRNLESH